MSPKTDGLEADGLDSFDLKRALGDGPRVANYNLLSFIRFYVSVFDL